MEKIKSAGTLILLCSVFVLALPLLSIAADEGMEYTVKKGDTLWDISTGNLKDPFLWPKLWKANPQVHNPHLIFPNEKIVIPAELLKEELRGRQVRLQTKRKLMVPSTARPVPSVNKRPIVTKEVLLESGYFVKEFRPVGRISMSILGDRDLLGAGNVVVLSTKVKADPNTKFYVTTAPETVLNPLNERQIAGYLVRIKGVAQVAGEENGRTKAVITESYKEIASGDYLIDYYNVDLPYAPTIERRPALGGIVLAVWNKMTESGGGDVIYLSKGVGQGVEIGDLFTITQGSAPNPIIGTAQVFAISDAGSAAVIKKATSEIRPGDSFGN